MPVYSALSGAPFTINTNSNGLEYDPEVAGLSDGGYVAVWTTVNQDGEQDGVAGQRFDARDSPVGPEFQVNTLTSSNQNVAHVTALSDGGFAVTYSSFGIDGSITGIALQRYSATGTTVGDEEVINQYTNSQQDLPVITELSDGNLVAVWQSYGSDGVLYGIAGRIIPATGDPVADEFQVNTYVTASQTNPDVAALSGGGFIAVWQSLEQDGSSEGVFAQRFDNGGNPVGDEFQVNTSTNSAQDRASVSALADGGFVVTWESSHMAIGSSEICGRVYNADGSTRVGEFLVSQTDTGFEQMPDVLGLSDGSFLVSWRSGGNASNPDEFPGGHYAMRFDADGAVLGDGILVTSDSPSAPRHMRLTELDNGDVIAVWNSSTGDTDGAQIMGQRLFTAGEISGTEGDDSLIGAGQDDRIQGLEGNDTLSGFDGNDTLIGGDGDDSLIGGTSEDDLRDVLYGGNGNDHLDGGYGNDELRGDAGMDTIIGGFGVDTIIGGTGDDQLTGQAWSDLIFGGDGIDFINGGFGYDRVNGGDGADRFFHLGVLDHGSDWIQDYNAADGDVLVFGQSGATADQFQINLANTPDAGSADVEEAFVIYRPTGQILWALVDGGGQDEINLVLDGITHDFLA